MPPKRKRAVKVSRSEGTDTQILSVPDTAQDIHHTIHRSTDGRMHRSVRVRLRTSADPEDNHQDHQDVISEEYIRESATAEFVDDDIGAIPRDLDSDDNLDANMDDGDEVVGINIHNPLF